MRNVIHYLRVFKRFLLNRNYILVLLIKNKLLRISFIKNLFRIEANYLYFKLIKNKSLVLISLTEHIGDIVACEPVSYYLKSKIPDAFIIWVVNEKYKELVTENKNLDLILTVTCLGEWIILKNRIKKFIKIFDLHLNGKPCPQYNLILDNDNPQEISINNYYYYGNLLKSFSLSANLEMPDIHPRLHLKEDSNFDFFLPKQYITIHTTSNEDSRCWKTESWNHLINQLLIAFPDFYVIEIGLNNVINIDSKRYINYCGKLSLRENALLIKRSFFYIGIDSGFAHFANAYKINSTILIGYYRDFKNYMPYSGFFNTNREDVIIYYNNILMEMPYEPVFTTIKNRIEKLLVFNGRNQSIE